MGGSSSGSGSEQEISEGLLSLFRETNPSSFSSLNQLILRLQSKLGFDLSDKIDFIRSQINSIFSQPPAQPQPQPQPQPPSPQQQQQQQLPSPSPVSRPLPSPVTPNSPNTPNLSNPNNPNLNVSHPSNPNLNVSYPTSTPSNPNNPNLNVSHLSPTNPNNPNLNVSYPAPTPNPSKPDNSNLNVSYPNAGNPNLNVSYPSTASSDNNPNLNVSHPTPTNLNNPNLNNPYPNPPSNPNLNVSYPSNPNSQTLSNPNVKVSYRPNNVPHHPHAAVKVEQHVFQGQSHFPNGPTEICFGQPAGGTVVNDFVSTPPTKDSGQKPKRRGGSGGLNKLCSVTPQLQAIVGQPTMPRTEIVKQLWAYIRKNNLQDPSNKRKIICNEELRLVFEVDCTDMFQMNKLLSKHILPLDSTKDSGQQSKKLKVDESKAQVPEPKIESKKLKVEESQAPIPEATHIVISEALANFFGTTELKMLQSDVYKRIEEYIKTEGLEDASSSMVICDPKLQELLGCESITASAVRDALARNLSNQPA